MESTVTLAEEKAEEWTEAFHRLSEGGDIGKLTGVH